MPAELVNELDNKYYPQIKTTLHNQAAIRAFAVYKSDPTKFWQCFQVETLSVFLKKWWTIAPKAAVMLNPIQNLMGVSC